MKRTIALILAGLVGLGSPLLAQQRPPTIRDEDPQARNPLLPPPPRTPGPLEPPEGLPPAPSPSESPPSATLEPVPPLGAAPGPLVPLHSLPGCFHAPLPPHPHIGNLPPLVTAPPPPEHVLRFGLDFLQWAFDRPPVPVPLLTTGDGSAVVAGQQRLSFPVASGVRVWGDWMFNTEYFIAVEGSYFILERVSDGLSVSSGSQGSPGLARPYLGAAGPAGLPVAVPGTAVGTFDLAGNLRLQGAHVAATWDVVRCPGLPNVRWLIGVQGLDLSESLGVNTTTTPVVRNGASFLGRGVSPPGSVAVFDSFSTDNRFIGLLLGLRIEQCLGERFSLAVTPRVALGPNYQHVDVEGYSSLVAGPGALPTTVPGGFLAQRTNINSRNNVRVSVVPQIGAMLTGRISDNLFVRLGYEGLLWKTVLRPGPQIDPNVSRSQVVTAGEFAPAGQGTRPSLPMQTREFWAQGLAVGLEVRY